MRNLQDATERICELKGSLVALDALLPAVIDTMSATGLSKLAASFDAHAEVARTLMLNSDMSDVVIAAFEREVARNGALLHRSLGLAPHMPLSAGLDPLQHCVTPVTAFCGTSRLSQDSGFFFRRNDQLFLVSSRRAMAGHEGGPSPERLEIEVAMDARSPTQRQRFSLALHAKGTRRWRDARDRQGPIDVAVMRIAPSELAQSPALMALDETHLAALGEDVALGDAVSIVGFAQALRNGEQPLLIARSGSIASPRDVRIQGRPSFLTELHAHEGSWGSPVLRRRSVSRAATAPAGWQLLGVHSGQPFGADAPTGAASSLALHQTWDANVLLSLTAGQAC